MNKIFLMISIFIATNKSIAKDSFDYNISEKQTNISMIHETHGFLIGPSMGHGKESKFQISALLGYTIFDFFIYGNLGQKIYTSEVKVNNSEESYMKIHFEPYNEISIGYKFNIMKFYLSPTYSFEKENKRYSISIGIDF